jgi:CHAD domain-containing protein
VLNKMSERLILPVGFGAECLRDELDEWSCETRQQESHLLTFWDTFEWGVWFSGHLLYSCEGVFHLCTREEGWPGMELCEEKAAGRRRFWSEFATPLMREKLEGMLGPRGLAPVVEGLFRRRQDDVRNDAGKIVCRLEWLSVSPGKRQEEELLHSCRMIPLLGYESEAHRLEEYLSLAGAKITGEGPLDLLLRQSDRIPEEYTLRPAFGLKSETPAREAVGRIVRSILEIATGTVPGILSDLDTEFLHDYRICLRKIRSVLSLLKEVFPAEETQRMRQILGDLARQTNRLRDLDVYLLARDEYLELLPPALRPALEEMYRDFSAERGVELRRLLSKLRASSWSRLIGDIEECFSVKSPHSSSPAADLPVGPLVYRCIYKRYRKIRVIAAGISAESPDDAVHQLRIEGKKLRYLMEFFAEIIPRDEGAALQKLLRRLQSQLGEFNDASVQQQSLLNYWEQKKSGNDVALGLGGLVSILYHRQQQSRAHILQAVEVFCGNATAASFKQIFKLPSSVPTTVPRSIQS